VSGTVQSVRDAAGAATGRLRGGQEGEKGRWKRRRESLEEMSTSKSQRKGKKKKESRCVVGSAERHIACGMKE